MTAAEVARLEGELTTLTAQHESVREAMWAKKRELDAARLALAQAEPHPWLGQRVERRRRHGYRTGHTIKRRGTVTAYDPQKHRGMRELPSYRIQAGDLIVVTDSRQTGHPFNETIHPEMGETAWELVK